MELLNCLCVAEIGKGFFAVEVIGDLPAEEARAFFQTRVLPSFRHDPTLPDKEWQSIYEVSWKAHNRCLSIFVLP